MQNMSLPFLQLSLLKLYLGLQGYTELVSICDMGSGDPAYHISSHIFANFLEPVIVLKIGKFPDKTGAKAWLKILGEVISPSSWNREEWQPGREKW